MSFFLGHFLTQNFGHFPTLPVSLGQFLPKNFGHFPPVNFGQIPACNFGHFMSARLDHFFGPCSGILGPIPIKLTMCNTYTYLWGGHIQISAYKSKTMGGVG